jgi:hypothetical protein
VLDGLVYFVGAGAYGDDAHSVLSFEPASEAWSALAPTTISRKYMASFVENRHLYVAGGRCGWGELTTSSVERYDVASNTWVAVANMLEARYFFNALTIGSTGPAEEQDLFDTLIAKAISGH